VIAVIRGKRHYTLPLDPSADDRILDAACRLLDAAPEREDHPIGWDAAIEKMRHALKGAAE
jgi:hypothetical protein